MVEEQFSMCPVEFHTTFSYLIDDDTTYGAFFREIQNKHLTVNTFRTYLFT